MSSKAQIIESLRETLTKVVKKDFSTVDVNESLNLDSINRISLIVELEWVYDIEIDSDGLDPEVFDTLNSLAGYIEGLVNESV
ncbi:MAG: acyl carrier protein [Alteromonadaceae bacterium]|jgi:acyl carrier protein|nr:acyl carrier protein [Alteromonadaceae bacterium]|tara:strand:+ start:1241 stop:1489 length:249 start_codon:yes stop_codon:yes gene_type:complete